MILALYNTFLNSILFIHNTIAQKYSDYFKGFRK